MSESDSIDPWISEKKETYISGNGGSASCGFWGKVKIALSLFLIFILVSSSVFIEKIMYNIPGLIESGEISNAGIIFQGICLTISYICIDTLVANGII